jgi:hypothetical protein
MWLLYHLSNVQLLEKLFLLLAIKSYAVLSPYFLICLFYHFQHRRRGNVFHQHTTDSSSKTSIHNYTNRIILFKNFSFFHTKVVFSVAMLLSCTSFGKFKYSCLDIKFSTHIRVVDRTYMCMVHLTCTILIIKQGAEI